MASSSCTVAGHLEITYTSSFWPELKQVLGDVECQPPLTQALRPGGHQLGFAPELRDTVRASPPQTQRKEEKPQGAVCQL